MLALIPVLEPLEALAVELVLCGLVVEPRVCLVVLGAGSVHGSPFFLTGTLQTIGGLAMDLRCRALRLPSVPARLGVTLARALCRVLRVSHVLRRDRFASLQPFPSLPQLLDPLLGQLGPAPRSLATVFIHTRIEPPTPLSVATSNDWWGSDLRAVGAPAAAG